MFRVLVGYEDTSFEFTFPDYDKAMIFAHACKNALGITSIDVLKRIGYHQFENKYAWIKEREATMIGF